MSEKLSNYSGSAYTAKRVAEEIEKRWGSNEVKNYDPNTNCLPFKRWAELSYKVRKGEKSIRSFTLIETKDEQGHVVSRHPKTAHLFYYLQVEKI